MKIAYGTYGMPTESPATAFPKIKAMGYDGIELCVWSQWPTAPEKLDARDRRHLKALFRENDLEFVALLMHLNALYQESESGREVCSSLEEAFRLGEDLSDGHSPLVTTVLGGKPHNWERERSILLGNLSALGDIAAKHGSLLAIEPHTGSLVNHPERAVWLLEQLNHPNVRLNFDMSHFIVEGIPLDLCARMLLPYTSYVHIKDARVQADGSFEFLLPGEGDFDLVAWYTALRDGGWDGFVTAEVSGHVRRRADYEPYAAARACYEALRGALDASHVA